MNSLKSIQNSVFCTSLYPSPQNLWQSIIFKICENSDTYIPTGDRGFQLAPLKPSVWHCVLVSPLLSTSSLNDHSNFLLQQSSHVSKNINQVLQSKQITLIRASVYCRVILKATVCTVGKVNHADIHWRALGASFVMPQFLIVMRPLGTHVIHDEEWAGVETIRVMWLDLSMKFLESFDDGI